MVAQMGASRARKEAIQARRNAAAGAAHFGAGTSQSPRSRLSKMLQWMTVPGVILSTGVG